MRKNFRIFIFLALLVFLSVAVGMGIAKFRMASTKINTESLKTEEGELDPMLDDNEPEENPEDIIEDPETEYL